MGLLDGILGSVVGAVLGGNNANANNAQPNPLGEILSSLTGGNQAQSGNMLGAVLKMMQQGGGLEGILGNLRANGLGKEVDSWVGTGSNLQASSDSLTKALGGALGPLASQLGLDPKQAGGALSKVLPELVNQLTPDGKMPNNAGALLEQMLGALQGKR